MKLGFYNKIKNRLIIRKNKIKKEIFISYAEEQVTIGNWKPIVPLFIKATNTNPTIRPAISPNMKNLNSIIPNCPFLLKIILKM